MKELYFVSMVFDSDDGATTATHNIIGQLWATSEDEAKGRAVAIVMEKNPSYSLRLVQVLAAEKAEQSSDNRSGN